MDVSATADVAGIVLRDATGRVRLQIGAGPDGVPSARLLDETGQATWQVIGQPVP